MRYYTLLDDHSVVPCDDLTKWAQGFETTLRNIKQEYVGTIYISTVFLGLNHNYSENGPPLVFETMVFGGKYDQVQYRTSTYAEALRAHILARDEVRRTWYGRWITFCNFLIRKHT